MSEDKQTTPTSPPPQHLIRIDAKLLESSLRYMVLKGKAWNNQNQAFTHLALVFMKDQWHNENDIASAVNDYLKNAPFTVKDIKGYLHNLAGLGILDSRTDKGIIKYKMTKLGFGTIIADEVMSNLFKMFIQEDKKDSKDDLNDITGGVTTQFPTVPEV